MPARGDHRILRTWGHKFRGVKTPPRDIYVVVQMVKIIKKLK